ncbi:MAG: SLBB domain-containing protein [Planctomycetes bacterium]|nr:SLBB domain-containing protein [Planctomycetota bacterium]
MGVLLPWVVALGVVGCGDRVHELTPEEKVVFERVGSIAPVVDMDRIERAIIATGPYRVVPGDILEVTMPVLLQAVTAAEVQSTQRASQVVSPYLLRVRDNGTIALPAVGPMKVVGLPLSEIEERITAAYEDYVIPHPSVFVRVAEYKTVHVYVAGAVKTPGVYALHADQMTLSSLLTQAGGVVDAGAAVVRVLRSERPAESAAATFPDAAQAVAGDANDRPEARAPTDETGPMGTSPQPCDLATESPSLSLASSLAAPTAATAPLPARSAALGRRETKPILLPVASTNIPYRDVALDEGDSVVVEPVQMPLFSVLGLVTKPGNFPYPPGAHYNLTQAIAFAGGLDPVARPYYVTIYRLNEDGSVARAPFRLLKNDKFTDALGTPIRPGDVVAVEDTPRTRMNTAIRDLVRINAGIYVTGRDLWERN